MTRAETPPAVSNWIERHPIFMRLYVPAVATFTLVAVIFDLRVR